MNSACNRREFIRNAVIGAVACLMAVESFNTGRRTTYDHKTRTIRNC
jgi:hypothetical protein